MLNDASIHISRLGNNCGRWILKLELFHWCNMVDYEWYIIMVLFGHMSMLLLFFPSPYPPPKTHQYQTIVILFKRLSPILSVKPCAKNWFEWQTIIVHWNDMQDAKYQHLTWNSDIVSHVCLSYGTEIGLLHSRIDQRWLLRYGEPRPRRRYSSIMSHLCHSIYSWRSRYRWAVPDNWCPESILVYGEIDKITLIDMKWITIIIRFGIGNSKVCRDGVSEFRPSLIDMLRRRMRNVVWLQKSCSNCLDWTLFCKSRSCLWTHRVYILHMISTAECQTCDFAYQSSHESWLL